MAGISTKLGGAGKGKRFMKRYAASKAVFLQAETQWVKTVALTVESMSKVGHYPPGAPVDTGRLRSSITHQMTGLTSAVVFTRSGYGLFVHDGTSRMRPRPFFETSITAADTRFQRAADKVGKDIVRKLIVTR